MVINQDEEAANLRAAPEITSTIFAVLDEAASAIIHLKGIEAVLTHMIGSDHVIERDELEMLSDVMHDAIGTVKSAIDRAIDLDMASR